jgi:hypothetical protein
MVRAFLLSYVARQLMVRPREEISARYPHPWLVWEPGAWVPPPPGKHMTLVPVPQGAERPIQGDALCFELTLAEGKTGLRLGRADDCDVIVNDATVSRSHLLLAVESDGWVALVSPSSRGAMTSGTLVAPGARVPLRRGTQVQLGDVQLTFYDSEGFLQRAEAESKKS